MTDTPTPNNRFSKLRVFLVDDDPFQLDFTSDMLNDIGAGDVIAAASGSDALSKFKSSIKKPDLIICDLQMPGMDGFDFMSHLAKLNYDGAIIIISGQEKRVRHSASLVAQISSFNFLGEIEKPVNITQLKSLIGQLK